MPQMAPLWWTSLYIMFIAMYMLTMIMMFFIYKPKGSNLENIKNLKTKNMNWKW